MGNRWSQEEMLTLRKIWKIQRPLHGLIDQLPGRTMDAINKQGEKMGLGNRPREAILRVRIREFMADKHERTAMQIAEAISASDMNIRRHLTHLVQEGLMHIVRYEGRYDTAIYAHGKGPTLAPPSRVLRNRDRIAEKKVRAPCTEQEKDDRYRDHKAEWWPYADPVVVSAFRALCGGA